MKVAFALLAVVLCPIAASAQETPVLRPHHLTIHLGLTSAGGYDIGVSTARLRGNGQGALPPAFTLFTADSHIERVVAPQLRIGVALSERVMVEGGIAQSKPRISVAISGDAEAPAQELRGEELQQYLFDGAVTWQLPKTLGRAAPFAIAGGGYLRQLHEDRTLGEGGQIYYAGGGARYWLRGGDRSSRAIGLRGDVRLTFRRNGIDFENKMRTFPAFSVALFIGL